MNKNKKWSGNGLYGFMQMISWKPHGTTRSKYNVIVIGNNSLSREIVLNNKEIFSFYQGKL